MRTIATRETWIRKAAIMAVSSVAIALIISSALAPSPQTAVSRAKTVPAPLPAGRTVDASFFNGAGVPVPAERLPQDAQQTGWQAGTLRWPNWSGYAVRAGKGVLINEITAQFTVPAVNCYSSSPSAQGAWLVEWAGIDGFGSTTVEQAGIETYCATKTSAPRYYGWYEMYPSPAVVRIGANAGDDVTVSIARNKDGRYVLALRDVTQGVGFSVLKSCPAGSSCKAASAELITEAIYKSGAYLPLADYGALTFANAKVQANLGKVRGTLAASKYWTLTKIDMVNSRGALESLPGSLYAGSDFTNTWKSS